MYRPTSDKKLQTVSMDAVSLSYRDRVVTGLLSINGRLNGIDNRQKVMRRVSSLVWVVAFVCEH